MSTPDIADFDLEAMMAELDEQTAEIVAATAAEAPAEAKTAEPEPEPIIKRTDHRGEEVKDDVVIDDDIDMDEIAAAVESTDDMPFEVDEPAQPTKADELTAEQELDLAEAFDPDANTAVVETPVELTAEEIAATIDTTAAEETIKPEPEPAVVIEPTPVVEPEPEKVAPVEETPAVELEDKTIPQFEPKPAEKPERSEKAMFELTKIKYQPDVEAFNRDIAFTDATLDAAMVSQASLVAYQNERAARAAAQAAKLKLKFDSIEALLYEAYRKDFLEKGVKVTEKAIENAVRKDSRWIKAKEAVIEAEMYADIHKGFVFALKDRNDMLIQRGSYRRQEMQGQMRFQESMEHATNPAHNQNVTDTSGHAAAMRALKNARG